MSGRVRILALLLAIPAGCSTVPRVRPPDVTLVPDQEWVAAPLLPGNSSNPIETTAPLPAPTNVPIPAARTGYINSNDAWIPLERWSESKGYGPPRRYFADVLPSYAFSSSNGTMAVKIGSQSAQWNNLEYRLGFAPQLIDGHPFVHSLDVRNNFLPLLNAAVHPRNNGVIVIDAGHGGTDIGTTNVVNGHFEKEFTLDWARRLQAILSTNGWTVWMTRIGDVTLPLSNRVALAELHKADLFLSLHFNTAFPDRQPAGLETYCLTPPGMPSNLTRGNRDDPALVYPNNSFDEENLKYAFEIHRALLNVNGRADRGIRRARFLGVLQGQNRPAVLVEGGYLSNPAEARKIADPAYRQKLAEAVAAALGEISPVEATRLVSQSPAAAPATNSDRSIY